MGVAELALGAVGAVILMGLKGLVSSEAAGWADDLAERIVKRAARRLTDPGARARYEYEWLAELEAVRSSRHLKRLMFALRVLTEAARVDDTVEGREPVSFHAARRAGKRTFDVVFASTMIVFLAPVLLTLVTVVRVMFGGPVIRRTLRTGAKGVPYAQLSLHVPARPDGSFQMALARVIRNGSFEELPILFNVVRGDMSIVGPRSKPGGHPPIARPGVTGFHGIYKEPDDYAQLDEFYARHWSLIADLALVVRTVLATFRPPRRPG